MAIWISSDWHCSPEGLREGVEQWLRLGKEGGHRLIGAGDLFDILPLGEKQWKSNSESISQLAMALDGYPFDYVTGNHDPHGTMVKLMAAHPNINMHKGLEFEHQGRKFFVTHGHRWAIDWGFLGLSRIAPPVVEFLTNSPLKGLWYRICRWRGWLASHEEQKDTTGKESQSINNLTRIIWKGASEHALKKNCCVILGHTHTTGYRGRGKGREEPFEAYMADGGNLPDGSYMEIPESDGKIVEIKWLPEANQTI